MKTLPCTHYSRAQAEQYLLNKMSLDQETHFQEHLETCDTCKAYISAIRKLSCLVANEELSYIQTPAQRVTIQRQKMRLYTYLSIAACVMLVSGVSLYFYTNKENRYGSSTHKIHINQQIKADHAEMTIEMLFPDEEIIWLSPDTPLQFKWNKEAQYKLIIRHNGHTIIETEGCGDLYTPESEKIKGYTVLDWVLLIDEKEFKGQIRTIE